MADASLASGSAIASDFRNYRDRYEAITAAAKRRFETGAWDEVQDAGAARLSYYTAYVEKAAAAVRRHHEGDSPSHHDWVATKAAYTECIRPLVDRELAETFFNSVHRTVTDDADVDADEMFVFESFPDELPGSQPIYRTHRPRDGDLIGMVGEVLDAAGFAPSWRDKDRDIGNILRSMAEECPEIDQVDAVELDVLQSVFYRNKGAYIVGRLRFKHLSWPVALPILRSRQGQLYVDTLISDVDELSVVFSFTRAYFMVLCDQPRALVEFLQELLPDKKRSELYASLGWHKHGKTEFYRGFLTHLENSNDQFIIAPGVKGMVMTVFTLPSYQTVFKIIKDKFAPQKNITAQTVREKYEVVKRHDRVGRMADTQEFSNFAFPLHRFAPDLIEELREVAPSSITLHDDRIVISHLYTERLMTPLNLHIGQASDAELVEALEEYGNAIKQLAAANIFPGDMLLKNFGITRHGRVVFYDYDEICYLSEVNFREIPEPRTPEEEMSDEIWYPVAKNDVFPEEFRRFLFGRRDIKQRFTEMHGELFDPAFWRQLQSAIDQGGHTDVFPYRRKRRFSRTMAAPEVALESELEASRENESKASRENESKASRENESKASGENESKAPRN